MARDINSEQEGRYDILQNNEGAILIMIKQRRGGPENPVLFMMAEILLCCIGVVKVPYFWAELMLMPAIL